MNVGTSGPPDVWWLRRIGRRWSRKFTTHASIYYKFCQVKLKYLF
jgi:hypothetical protein